MISDRLFRSFYPGDAHNGTLQFYRWVREYTRPETEMLNLGAGPPTHKAARTFRGQVARIVGADIDPVVLENDELDEAVLIRDGHIPVPDCAFDLVVSDFVLEHVEYPIAFLREAHRVLRPGGSFFFRTPNLYHYVGIITRCTPHWVHELLANRVRGLSDEDHEPWPTYHRLNTRRRIAKSATLAGFADVEFRMCEAEPSYLQFSSIPFLLGVAYERTVNHFDQLAALRVNIFGRLFRG